MFVFFTWSFFPEDDPTNERVLCHASIEIQNRYHDATVLQLYRIHVETEINKKSISHFLECSLHAPNAH